MRRTVYGGVLFGVCVVAALSYAMLFMIAPALPLMFINAGWFRKYVDYVGTFYLFYATSLLYQVYGVRLVLTGDKVDCSKRGNNLLILNHRTRIDWMFLFCCLYQHSYQSLLNLKITPKQPLKHLFTVGWIMQADMYLFLKRQVEVDRRAISKALSYFKRVNKDANVLLFPEGRDLDTHSLEMSDEYAEQKGLPKYRYTLHPKTSGFHLFMNEMRLAGNFNDLYDMTVAYKHTIPQSELAIVKGKFPEEVHFHIKRYPQVSLPTNENELKELCRTFWKEKEERLSNFYDKNLGLDGNAETHTSLCNTQQTIVHVLAIIYWLPFTLLSIYVTISSTFVLTYIVLCSLCLTVVNVYFDGLDTLQINL